MSVKQGRGRYGLGVGIRWMGLAVGLVLAAAGCGGSGLPSPLLSTSPPPTALNQARAQAATLLCAELKGGVQEAIDRFAQLPEGTLRDAVAAIDQMDKEEQRLKEISDTFRHAGDSKKADEIRQLAFVLDDWEQWIQNSVIGGDRNASPPPIMAPLLLSVTAGVDCSPAS
jgi:hypothetical protein